MHTHMHACIDIHTYNTYIHMYIKSVNVVGSALTLVLVVRMNYMN